MPDSTTRRKAYAIKVMRPNRRAAMATMGRGYIPSADTLFPNGSFGPTPLRGVTPSFRRRNSMPSAPAPSQRRTRAAAPISRPPTKPPARAGLKPGRSASRPVARAGATPSMKGTRPASRAPLGGARTMPRPRKR